MTEVDWLCGRYPSPPEGLRVKLEAGMMYSGQEATPDLLRDAASVSLKKALDRSRDRAAAFQGRRGSKEFGGGDGGHPSFLV